VWSKLNCYKLKLGYYELKIFSVNDVVIKRKKTSRKYAKDEKKGMKTYYPPNHKGRQPERKKGTTKQLGNI
jgi:hypothetical protein